MLMDSPGGITSNPLLREKLNWAEAFNKECEIQ